MLRVQDVMTSGVVTIAPDQALDVAGELMRQHEIHHLVVADDEGVVGMLSARDLAEARRASSRRRTVGEAMTTRPLEIAMDVPVRRAANRMRGRSVGSLIVRDRDGRLVGIVTVSDLLDALGRGGVHPTARAPRHGLSHRVAHRHRRAADGMW